MAGASVWTKVKLITGLVAGAGAVIGAISTIRLPARNHPPSITAISGPKTAKVGDRITLGCVPKDVDNDTMLVSWSSSRAADTGRSFTFYARPQPGNDTIIIGVVDQHGAHAQERWIIAVEARPTASPPLAWSEQLDYGAPYTAFGKLTVKFIKGHLGSARAIGDPGPFPRVWVSLQSTDSVTEAPGFAQDGSSVDNSYSGQFVAWLDYKGSFYFRMGTSDYSMKYLSWRDPHNNDLSGKDAYVGTELALAITQLPGVPGH